MYGRDIVAIPKLVGLKTRSERLLLALDVHTLAYLHTCDSLQEMREIFDVLKELREQQAVRDASRRRKGKGGGA